MFSFFTSKKKTLPEFKALHESGIKDKYFYRVATWKSPNKDAIYVIDPNKPRVITMDAWPQVVFLEADGQKNIEELVHQMANKYKKVPDGLDQTILYQINQLLNEKLIALSDTKVDLAPPFTTPQP